MISMRKHLTLGNEELFTSYLWAVTAHKAKFCSQSHYINEEQLELGATTHLPTDLPPNGVSF